MANELLNPVAILQESLMRMENNTVLAKQVNREFDDKFAIENEKVGYQVNARVPARFRGRTGDAIQTEDIREQMVPIAINLLAGVDLDISDQDLTLTIDRFGERYIDGASATIANRVDGAGYDLYNEIFSVSGTPGVMPTSLPVYGNARAVLANHAVPMGTNQLAMIVNPDQEVNVLGFGSNLFNPVNEISRQYTDGTMGRALGFKWAMGQNVPVHVVGALGSAQPTVTTAPANGDKQIVTGNWTASTAILKKGDIVSFAGCNAVNPVSYRDVGKLRTFVVTDDVSSDGSGNATIPVSPAFDADGGDATRPGSQFQTVVSLPAAGANIRVFNQLQAGFAAIAGATSPQAFAFHRDALTLAAVKLALPGGLDWSEQITNPKMGIALRLTRGFNMQTNRRYTRLETLCGWKVLQPQFACRVCG